jgi:hypothetical protein
MILIKTYWNLSGSPTKFLGKGLSLSFGGTKFKIVFKFFI